MPFGSWPGLDLTPGTEFWALLPAFVAVTLVGAVETLGDAVAIQRVSRRRPRATDFRVVQGALNADGMGNLLSGLAGTTPNTTYSSSISLAELTGIGARRVGVVIGIILILLAFFPKLTALLIAIPGPVAGAFVTFLIALLFIQGMRIVLSDGIDHRKAVIAGVSFWVGVGFQSHLIFPDVIGEGFMAVLLGNGMTAGAIVAALGVLGADQFPPQVPPGRAGRRGSTQGARLRPRVRDAPQVGRRGSGQAGRRERGDAGHTYAIRRGGR